MIYNQVRDITIASIISIVCFILLGGILLFCSAYFLIFAYGLLSETTKEEIIITHIIFIFLPIIPSFLATRAGLLITNKNRIQSWKGILLLLPTCYLVKPRKVDFKTFYP
jgi:hypothetical protein